MTASRSRRANVARNSLIGLVAQFLVFGAGLVYRTVLIHYLSVEYLGAQGLFGDVLNMLSLAEFGIANAILFSLYAPMARGDHAHAAALLLLYKRLYRVVGLVVLVVGLAFVPFLDHLVKSGADLDHFELIYVLLLVDVVVGYWSAYRKTLFVADQQEYRVALSGAVISVLRSAAQIAALVFTGSFLLTLALKIVGTLATNLYQSWMAGRVYPEIIRSTPSKLEKDFLSDNFAKMRALMLHKISALVISATDSILVARFFGLGPVGVYSNYLVLLGMVTAIAYPFLNAVMVSVGHLAATETTEKSFKTFKVLEFGYQWIYAFTSLMLFTLLTPFIGLWLGYDLTFTQGIVAAICLNFYLIGRGAGCQAYRNARGLFRRDRWSGPVEAVLNIVLSITLLHQIGIAGIFLGTAISHLLLSAWIVPVVVFRHYFDLPAGRYLLQRVVELVEVVILALPLYLLQRELAPHGVLGFIALGLVSAVLVNAYLVARHWRNDSFRDMSAAVVGGLRARLSRSEQESSS